MSKQSDEEFFAELAKRVVDVPQFHNLDEVAKALGVDIRALRQPTHKDQFIAMIEPRQSFHLSEKHNAVYILGIYDDPDLSLWFYFDRKTGEFLELRVES